MKFCSKISSKKIACLTAGVLSVVLAAVFLTALAIALLYPDAGNDNVQRTGTTAESVVVTKAVAETSDPPPVDENIREIAVVDTAEEGDQEEEDEEKSETDLTAETDSAIENEIIINEAVNRATTSEVAEKITEKAIQQEVTLKDVQPKNIQRSANLTTISRSEQKADIVKKPPPAPKVQAAELPEIKTRQPVVVKNDYLIDQLKINPERYSTDPKIIAALNLLKEKRAEEIFDNLDILNAEVKFYDFELLGYEYRKHYAINTKKNGKTVIAVNTRYKDSPVEAIASLIVHESFHKLGTATLEEEVLCTMMEARYWRMLKVPGKSYDDEDVLVFKLDNWASMYLATTKDYNPIRTKISNSAFYKERLV